MPNNSTIKPKTGKCPKCPPTVKDQLLIGGLCSMHYWKSRSKKKSIKPRSDKKMAQDLVYGALRAQFLKDHPLCEAKLPGCYHTANQVHHKLGRLGTNYLDTRTWLAICDQCHHEITTNSVQAIEKGLSERRNTPLK